MLAYPHVAHALFPEGDSKHKGLFIGLAVHDTAQVMGCAASYAEQYAEEAVVSAAAVAKLTRNVFLAGVVPLMAVRHGGAAGASSFAAALPTFVLGFVRRPRGDEVVARRRRRRPRDPVILEPRRRCDAFSASPRRVSTDATSPATQSS